MSKPQKHHGFKYLPVQGYKEGVIYLYYKKHSQTVQDQHTLFVANIPLSFNLGEIKELFQCFGEVSEVNMIERGLSKTPTNSAHVVYSDEKCIERALKFEPKNNVQPFSMETETCGLVKWIKDYESLRPDVSKLQFKVDKFMEIFEEKERLAKQSLKQGPVVDEDGFTLVQYGTSKKRKNPTKQDIEEQEKAKASNKKKTVVLDFYRHQARENKREEIADLRLKFEEDKKKVEKMKAQRKFNPF